MTIMSEKKVKLLGIHIDNRLNFDYHISQLCKKAGKNCMLELEFSNTWTFHRANLL